MRKALELTRLTLWGALLFGQPVLKAMLKPLSSWYAGYSSQLEYNSPLDPQHESGSSPLWVASQEGKLEMVKFLVENQANIGLTHQDGTMHMTSGTSAISKACQNGHIEVVKYLHGLGAEIHDQDSHGITCLWNAASNGHSDIVQYLV